MQAEPGASGLGADSSVNQDTKQSKAQRKEKSSEIPGCLQEHWGWAGARGGCWLCGMKAPHSACPSRWATPAPGATPSMAKMSLHLACLAGLDILTGSREACAVLLWERSSLPALLQRRRGGFQRQERHKEHIPK